LCIEDTFPSFTVLGIFKRKTVFMGCLTFDDRTVCCCWHKMSHPNLHSLTRKLVHDGVDIEVCSDIAATTATFQFIFHSSFPNHLTLFSLWHPRSNSESHKWRNGAGGWAEFLSGQSYNSKLSVATIVELQKERKRLPIMFRKAWL